MEIKEQKSKPLKCPKCDGQDVVAVFENPNPQARLRLGCWTCGEVFDGE